MFSSFIPLIYVQISPERLVLRNAKTGEVVSEVPEIAISRKPKSSVLGCGVEARLHASAPSVEIINPFAHPRSIVSDFLAGEQLLKDFLRRLQGSSIFAVSPKVVMHPLGDPEGGLTQIEVRALCEMALGAGASGVVVWQGRKLTDQELLSGSFPAGGQVLS